MRSKAAQQAAQSNAILSGQRHGVLEETRGGGRRQGEKGINEGGDPWDIHMGRNAAFPQVSSKNIDKLALAELTPFIMVSIVVQVAALKSDCKAHLLRGKALMEQLRLDAVNNNAGKEVGEKWDQVMDLLADADDGFDDIMTLYKLDDDDEDS